MLLIFLDKGDWHGSSWHAEKIPNTCVNEGEEDLSSHFDAVGLAAEPRSDNIVKFHTFPPGTKRSSQFINFRPVSAVLGYSKLFEGFDRGSVNSGSETTGQT